MHQRATLLPVERRRFRARLLRWYGENRRSLPWRGEADPYRVWVSEIMLQQTRVNAMKDHYQDFLQRFPTVEKLAQAAPAAVLAAWSGLGYYRRARALHAAAMEITRAGAFPRTAAQWRELPGVGRYTAAAVASIAFGGRCAAVDGNVERVFARLFGVTANDCWPLAQQLLSPSRPGDFNQALMELGATVCVPRAPACHACPLADFCVTRGEIAEPRLPARKMREIALQLIRRRNAILLVQRPSTASLMPQMWELPASRRRQTGNPVLQARHAITTTDYRVQVFAGAPHRRRYSGSWVHLSRVPDLPLTGLTRKILKRLEFI